MDPGGNSAGRTGGVRVLLVADTHLGLDLPRNPRVERRRRGPDFFRNFETALAPAHRGEVDLVVHGGDLLYRSKVQGWLVERAVAPLIRVADAGVPVILVPGNHERSRIPFPLLAAHPNLYLMDRPRTVPLELRGHEVAVSGFPCIRNGIRDRFPRAVRETGCQDHRGCIRLLCLHQTVEGSTVGPSDYTFRYGEDIVRGSDIPAGFAAVLAGHIHRHQMLTSDLRGKPLAAPVLYPGSVERTSTAERDETKGYLVLEFSAAAGGGSLDRWTFHPLPARPMVDLDLPVERLGREEVERSLRGMLEDVDPDAIVRITPVGTVSREARPVLRAASLRDIAPPTMTLSIRNTWQRRTRG